ncbi:phosphoenolpyruvate hydrolase family protein, partial [Singulisphaera rosea]
MSERLKRFRSERIGESGRPDSPILGVVADTGQVARLAAELHVDFLLGLSAGVYRNQGISALATCLPFQNSNDVMEGLVRDRILPASGTTPVVAGVLAGDPTCPADERLARLRSWGVAGVINYPSLTLLDGNIRQIFEAEGCTVEAETRLLDDARKFGLATIGFVGAEVEAVSQFVESGIDMLILTAGLTRVLDDIPERRDRLQQDIRRLNKALDVARRINPRLLCLVFGGPITLPEDLEQVYRQSTFDGFVGGSVFGRFPIEGAVTTAIRRFQAVAIHPEGERQTGLGPMIGTTPAMRELFRLIP